MTCAARRFLEKPGRRELATARTSTSSSTPASVRARTTSPIVACSYPIVATVCTATPRAEPPRPPSIRVVGAVPQPHPFAVPFVHLSERVVAYAHMAIDLCPVGAAVARHEIPLLLEPVVVVHA